MHILQIDLTQPTQTTFFPANKNLNSQSAPAIPVSHRSTMNGVLPRQEYRGGWPHGNTGTDSCPPLRPSPMQSQLLRPPSMLPDRPDLLRRDILEPLLLSTRR
ncbi:hypothetical protein B0T21DRAFT_361930 [Apiosordaria backusii]|uniref:Uncharacterized protein n=1 Tax=Apiosordaria backusii TaxID=314023 RepID=A0AA40BRL7_9PEZI|nr:hypothetical protein B0T21DRAFT_361930 [Apiosordaria backusii]